MVLAKSTVVSHRILITLRGLEVKTEVDRDGNDGMFLSISNRAIEACSP